jgi:putative phosphoribosyl transferase
MRIPQMRPDQVLFHDRADAGRQLAALLSNHVDQSAIVLALPRGGVPVGYEVARQLHVPLDILLVRKLGAPFEPELAMGAIASGDVRILHEPVLRDLAVTAEELERVTAQERSELERRERRFRAGREAIPLQDCSVIIVDDGIATGSTVRAAVIAAQRRGAKHVMVAVPVAPRDTLEELRREGIEVVAVARPSVFFSIGGAYDSFPQLTDNEVAQFLEKAETDSGKRRRLL